MRIELNPLGRDRIQLKHRRGLPGPVTEPDFPILFGSPGNRCGREGRGPRRDVSIELAQEAFPTVIDRVKTDYETLTTTKRCLDGPATREIASSP